MQHCISLEALFPGGVLNAAALSLHKMTLDKLVSPTLMTGADILWALGVHLSLNTQASKMFPMVLKTLYFEDWATEDDILAYYVSGGTGHPGFDLAKVAASPFITWLF